MFQRTGCHISSCIHGSAAFDVTKPQLLYTCHQCGFQARQSFGRCPACGGWNTLQEQRTQVNRSGGHRAGPSVVDGQQRSCPIAAVEHTLSPRLRSGFAELDRVLGGGLVPGSIVLVGGDPGIGKSTLLLQAAHQLARHVTVLYVSAEESAQQVHRTWSRLCGGAATAAMAEPDTEAVKQRLHLLAETDVEVVLQELDALAPGVAVIDSIQALHDPGLSSAAGSVVQVRECAAALQRLAKRRDIAMLLVGHVTKEGMLAGPRTLEHLVDTVLSFEGDRFATYRLLRSLKNRFGATFELGVFEMRDAGLVEVANPSQIFLSTGQSTSGTAIIVACEGTRPLVVELQALVCPSSYGSPRRSATGIASNRLNQILAVLEKQLTLPLSRFDCYLAVAGGLDVVEPAADLGVAAAVVASFRDLLLPQGLVLIGELGLGGQLRPVTQLDQRLLEAERLGFTRALVPANSDWGESVAMAVDEATDIRAALASVWGSDPAMDAARDEAAV